MVTNLVTSPATHWLLPPSSVSQAQWVQLVHGPGSHQAGLDPYLEVLGENPLPDSLRLLTKFRSRQWWGWAPIFLLASCPGVLLSSWRPHPFLGSETPSSAFQASNTQSSPSQDANPSDLPSPSFFLLHLSDVSQRNASALWVQVTRLGPTRWSRTILLYS